MLNEAIRSQYLADELQLRQSLNEAVQQGHSAYFSLLLALLSPDMLDQFSEPQPSTFPSRAILRSEWPLAPEIPLELPDTAWRHHAEYPENLSRILHEEGMTAVRWQTAIAPEPLCRNQYALHPLVWEDMSPLQQEKHRLQHQTIDDPMRSPVHEEHQLMVDSVGESRDWQELKVHYYRPIASRRKKTERVI